MRNNAFLIIKFLSRFLSNKLMISRYSTMFYNNVMLYRKVLFWLKTCKQQQTIHLKKHSRSSRANGKIKQTVPITVQNVGYIYSSQPIFIVFKLFHILILRETINVHMLRWKFVPQSGNNNNVLAKITCADSFFSAFFVLKHSPSRKLYICLKIISLLDKLFSAQSSKAALICSHECSDGELSFLSRLCLYFMISHCGGDIMINQFH